MAECGIAAALLAVARFEIAALRPRDYLRDPTVGSCPTDVQDIARRIARAIDRAARRVPWRSDCLVQALAARRWLAAKGIASRLHIGVRSGAAFSAHAWVSVGDRILIGGDVSQFVEFEDPGVASRAVR